MLTRRAPLARRWTSGLLLAATVVMAAGVAAAPAHAASRTLKLYFTHTKENLEIVYKRNGRYVPSALREINRFLRDWRRNESTKIDPELLDLVWEVYRDVGAGKPVHVVSAYRSPATNNMLRQRSRGVAKTSQHTAGRAMDFYIPGVPVAKLREAAFRKQVGGVGYYPRSGSPFVHLDTGRVRSWPRMSRTQLAGIFPDGKTVHLPSDGKPLKGYAEAQALEKAGRLASLGSSGGGGGFRLPSLGFGGRGSSGGNTVVASLNPDGNVIRPGTYRSEGGAVVAAVLSSERSQRAETALADADPERVEDEADEGESRSRIGRLIDRFTGSRDDEKTDEPSRETVVAAAPAPSGGDAAALPGVTAAADASADASRGSPRRVSVPLPRSAPRDDRQAPIVLAALPPDKPVGYVSDPTILSYSSADRVATATDATALGATASLIPGRPLAPAATGLSVEGGAAGSGVGAFTDPDPAGDGAAVTFVAPNPRDPMLLAADAPIEGEWFGELIPHDETDALDGAEDGAGGAAGTRALSAALDGVPLRFTTDQNSTWARADRFRGISIVVFAPPRG